MPTVIRYIRHPFNPDAADKLDTLLAFLAEYTLDPTFERYGDFLSECEPSWWEALGDQVAGLDRRLAVHVWGNFWDLSAVFDVITDDEEVIAKLALAIRANKATVAYKEARDQRQAQADYWAVQERRRRKEATADARRRARAR